MLTSKIYFIKNKFKTEYTCVNSEEIEDYPFNEAIHWRRADEFLVAD